MRPTRSRRRVAFALAAARQGSAHVEAGFVLVVAHVVQVELLLAIHEQKRAAQQGLLHLHIVALQHLTRFEAHGVAGGVGGWQRGLRLPRNRHGCGGRGGQHAAGSIGGGGDHGGRHGVELTTGRLLSQHGGCQRTQGQEGKDTKQHTGK